ncbi:hypothetical protein HII31_04278 [Pseudocercospora fuligena]|uniref:Uncharacterized protein n=1 Tax=Pseudocercospora fuligena TaxID=685502 RepID=A0A8H6VJ73_9PEZI|nr:hypothetical protein HII31_04278 [Pseudocercospora fuligena]
MAALETPPPDSFQNQGFFPDKDAKPMTGRMDDRAFAGVKGNVATDLFSFQRSLINALDALRVTDNSKEIKDNSEEIRKLRERLYTLIIDFDKLNVEYRQFKLDCDLKFEDYEAKFELAKIKEDTEHFNASARNYNAAMDRHSKTLRQLKSTDPSHKNFGGSIECFPTEVGQINTMSGKQNDPLQNDPLIQIKNPFPDHVNPDTKIIAILEALSIKDHHDTDSHKKLHDAHLHDHHHQDPSIRGKDNTDAGKRSAMLKRQLRLACGLSAFQFATVTINTIDGEDLC